ncbi:MAG TPA: hypothetical protein VH593_11740 [Ktedonobacteraceae bacterium]|jgi:hypothetical protein
MKAVATAIVLIAAAAVVLWSGATLNSWMLGGLIGGLAALLISVPVSLALFSHLANQQNSLFGEAVLRKKVSLSQVDAYPPEYFDELDGNEREVEGSLYALEQDYPSEEDFYLQYPDYDNDRSPSAYQRAPLHANNQPLKRLSAPQRRGTSSFQTSKKLSEPMTARGKSAQGDRRSGRIAPSNSTLSQYRSQALRAARQEATRHRNEMTYREEDAEQEDFSAPSHRYSDEPERSYPSVPRRASRHLSTQANLQRPRRGTMEEDLLMQRFSQEAEDMYEDDAEIDHHYPRTEYRLHNSYPRTEPVERISSLNRGQRHQRQQKDLFDPETTTDSARRPLIRRAPYLYDDDPLRQELSPYFDHPPAIRRTSRLRRSSEDR